MKSLRTLRFLLEISGRRWSRADAWIGAFSGRQLRVAVGVIWAGQLALGCQRERPFPPNERSSPAVDFAQAVASAGPELCARSPGRVQDDTTRAFFPVTLGEYCLDPHADTRVHGGTAALPLHAACLELAQDGCADLELAGVERAVVQRYVGGSESLGRVQVSLLQFATPEAALAFLTERVVGISDPAALALRPLQVGSVGVVLEGAVLLTRGQHLAELVYSHEREAAEQRRQSADLILPALAMELANRLPGAVDLPLELRALPLEHRLPMGVRYQLEDALGISGTGPAAVGYYAKGQQRWRVLSIERSDPEAAKDVAHTLQRGEGFRRGKNSPYGSFRLEFPHGSGGLTEHWVIARQGGRVWGIGDEPHALDERLSEREIAARCLSHGEKLEHLGKLLASAP